MAAMVAGGYASVVGAATPQTWVTPIDAATYGSSGTITFNDWGYRGPLDSGANDFQVPGTGGFDPARLGHKQQVVTRVADGKTPDPRYDFEADPVSSAGVGTPLPNASVDGQVNFYKWGYTSPAGSTFITQVDKAGNHFAAKSDMSFGFYDLFEYDDGSGTVQTIDTGINFQPRPISDARGWCGSVLLPDLNAVAPMAGQLKFDVVFDVYMLNGGPGRLFSSFTTQVIPGFVMRSYGDYVVDVTTAGGDRVTFTGSTVGNNTNPETGAVDPAFQNLVSFAGAGVIPKGAWVLGDGTDDIQVVEEGTPGAVWHGNSFAGYAFLLRADAQRTVIFVADDGYSDYVSAIPLPGAVWLLGPALAGLAAARRRRPVR
jgi:hypothetical protein